MKFDYTSTLSETVDDIPQPKELTNKFSQQEGSDLVQILNEVSSFLRLHGASDRNTYIVPMTKPESLRTSRGAEKVLAQAAEILADNRNWNVNFKIDSASSMRVILRGEVTIQNPDKDEVDQLDLF
jgi:hypothetical protein